MVRVEMPREGMNKPPKATPLQSAFVVLLAVGVMLLGFGGLAYLIFK